MESDMADLANPKWHQRESPFLGRHVGELTSRKTRRQVWRQIYIPIGIGVFLLALMVVGLIWAGAGTTSIWSDISVVLILLPVFIFGLIFLVILIGLTYVVVRLIDLIPDPMQRMYLNIERIRQGTWQGTDAMVKPIFIVGATKTALETAWNLLISIFRIN
jgi:hypothetical protein